MAEEQSDNELAEFARQLAGVEPRESRIDHAVLLFRAGQASVSRPDRWASARLLWPFSTAILLLVTAILSWQLYRGQEPKIVERVRYVEVPVVSAVRQMEQEAVPTSLAVKADSALAPGHYLSQRRLALRIGLDALASPFISDESSDYQHASYRELKEDLLGIVGEDGQLSSENRL